MSGWKAGITKAFRWLVPLVVSGLAIWFLLREVDLQKLVAAYTQIRISTIIFAIIIALFSLLLRVVCWYLLLRKQISFKRVFFVMNAGYLLNNIFPFRLGEFGRAILIGENNNREISTLQVLSSIFVERIMDVFLALVFFLGALTLFTDNKAGRGVSVVLLISLLVIFITLMILAAKKEGVNRWMEARKIKNYRLFHWLQPKINAILEGFSVITQWRFVLPGFLLLLLSWILSMLQQYVIVLDIIPQAQFWWVVLLIGAGALGFAVPSAPAGIGVYEAAMVGAFLLLNVDSEPALAIALVLHAMQFVISAIFGTVGLIREGQSIQSLIGRAVSRKRQEV